MIREKGFIIFQGMHVKANCYACEHLMWEDGDVGDPSGYVCLDREYENQKKQDELEVNMQRDKYLKRSKRCCELKF